MLMRLLRAHWHPRDNLQQPSRICTYVAPSKVAVFERATMLDKKIRKAIEAIALAGGATPEHIAQALACLDGRATPEDPDPKLTLLSQADKARQLGVSRFTVRKLVKVGRLHPVELLPSLWRFRSDELPGQ